jgi:DNA-binding MarR family transcriptional regulator
MTALVTKPQTTWQLARDLLDGTAHAKKVARVIRLTTHLTMTEWLLLNRLAMSTEERPGNLAKCLGISAEMVNMTTPGLIKQSYLIRGTQMMGDLRGRCLRITDEGRTVLNAAHKALVEADLVRPAEEGVEGSA